jgi:hypothetical protein
MRAQELGTAAAVPMIFDRARTDVIQSRRLVQETEAVLSEALEILRSLDGPASTWRATADERDAWTRMLDGSIRQLSDVRNTLHSLLDGSRLNGSGPSDG